MPRVLLEMYRPSHEIASELSLFGGRLVKRGCCVMLALMAGRTESDQIVQCIVSQPASLNLMMHMQVSQRPTILTPPPISFEHSTSK